MRVGIIAGLLLGACNAQPPARSAEAPRSDDRIARVEAEVVPAITIRGAPAVERSLAARMVHFRVPAVSVVVIEGGELAWAKAWGSVEPNGARATPATLFQAGSISKGVAAMVALKVAESGRLELDADVSGALRSWRVPQSELSAGAPITVRGLLSHTAGFGVSGFPGYARGAKIPALADVLEGRPPANTAAIRVEVRPGTEWRYSGGGYTVLQQLIEDVEGRPFADVARARVLAPLGMTASTFEQPLPESWAARAAAGTHQSGEPVKGRWHVYPELAAAGLWTTPRDLARFVIEIQRPGRVLSDASVRAMRTPVKEDYALGLLMSGSGAGRRFEHTGKNEGFQAFLVGYASGGRGAVVMTNSENGRTLAVEIVRAIAREYRWPDYPQGELRDVIALSHEQLRRYAGSFEAGGETIEIAVEGDGLVLFAPERPNDKMRLVAASELEFFVLDDGLSIRFVLEGDAVTGVRIGDGIRAIELRKRVSP